MERRTGEERIRLSDISQFAWLVYFLDDPSLNQFFYFVND